MQRAGKFTVAELRVPGLGGCEGGEAVETKAGKALQAGVLLTVLVKVPALC